MKEIKKLFFQKIPLEEEKLCKLTKESLYHLDDGDLYMQHAVSSSLTFEDGVIRSASHDTLAGFGMRGVMGDETVFTHASGFDWQKLQKAGKLIRTVRDGYIGQKNMNDIKKMSVQPCYQIYETIGDPFFFKWVPLLHKMDQHARRDLRVVHVSICISTSRNLIGIFNTQDSYFDFRPLTYCSVSIVVMDKNRREQGQYGFGGREDSEIYLQDSNILYAVDCALNQALINLDARPAPAGEMPVVLNSGWPGILLHEAVGHGLEGDFNRKKTSAFWNKMGSRVASKGVYVVDDGTLPGKRGSLTIDDEGTATKCTTLIEDGILTGYMQDRLNARLMGMPLTGNGRRESYAFLPMPRMTNTYMLQGDSHVDEMITSIKSGIYAVNFGGGQVDITNGKFVFSCTLAYAIENGKLGAPLKGVMLMGNGPDILTKVSYIGSDFSLDSGVGTCGKNGQNIPVGVGQPTIKIDSLLVGGTCF